MRLYIDLNLQEQADIAGWVNYYAAHPELIDTPPGVTRIVLAERTRARYEQIAAQFAVAPPYNGPVCDMGGLVFTAPVFSSGFGGTAVAIASLYAPPGLPTATNTLSVYEQYQTTAVWRQGWLSKVRGDMSARVAPAFQQGMGGMTFNYSIGGSDPNAVNMRPGETWYLMVANRNPDGSASCKTGNCEIGIKWYPPV